MLNQVAGFSLSLSHADDLRNAYEVETLVENLIVEKIEKTKLLV